MREALVQLFGLLEEREDADALSEDLENVDRECFELPGLPSILHVVEDAGDDCPRAEPALAFDAAAVVGLVAWSGSISRDASE